MYSTHSNYSITLITQMAYLIILFLPNLLNPFFEFTSSFYLTKQARVYMYMTKYASTSETWQWLKKTRSSHSLPLFKDSTYIEGCGFHMFGNVKAVKEKTGSLLVKNCSCSRIANGQKSLVFKNRLWSNLTCGQESLVVKSCSCYLL